MYPNKDIKDSNINYVNKDFSSLKSTLVEYAKTYFPNTYRDFNETSPGMMLIEMSAYVGDVLNFYIDQQYREMLLPLAEERRNVINLANMLGYKVKSITPAKSEVTVTIDVGVAGTFNNPHPDWTGAFLIKGGMQIGSTSDSSIIFETVGDIDFTISGAYDSPQSQSTWNDQGYVTQYTLTRKMLAISGKTVTKDFSIGSPEQFLQLTLSETNVIEIISVKDSNNNTWYEVQYLAQDNVPVNTAYYDHGYRNTDDLASAYLPLDTDADNSTPEAPMQVAVPYTLEYIKAPKRFITEIDVDGYTSLIFGNGLLKTGGSTLDSDWHTTQQAGMVLPGDEIQLNRAISDTIGTAYSTLGETPSNTILTVQYRIGGGIKSNVPAGDLTTLIGSPATYGVDNGSITVNNIDPARGGSSGETVEEIKQRAKAYFSTQERCVTKEDFEARVMNLPAKFGNIAKVYCTRAQVDDVFNYVSSSGGAPDIQISEFRGLWDGTVPTVELYMLSYDHNKYLVNSPQLLKNNLKNYLNQYRMITDGIVLRNGFIINFGVLFDISAHKFVNKQEVKIRCIEKIKDFFRIEKMQFKQPIYVSDLEYLLMGVDGVRSVNHVTITQHQDYKSGGYTIATATGAEVMNQLLASSYIDLDGNITSIANGSTNYGFFYDFYSAQSSDNSIIIPSYDAAVFELKYPDTDIKGVVR